MSETIKLPSLKETPAVVRKILTQNRSQYSISIEKDHYEHLKIRGKRIDLFRSDIESIEKQTGFKFHGMVYWNEPDFCDKHPQMPKYMRDYTAGNHVEIRFVREIKQSQIKN